VIDVSILVILKLMDSVVYLVYVYQHCSRHDTGVGASIKRIIERQVLLKLPQDVKRRLSKPLEAYEMLVI